MSTDPSLRSATRGIVGTRARRMPVRSHSGTRRDFLRRHERECREAARANRETRERLINDLLTRAADTRNILPAIESLASRGDKAGGPDGIRLGDIPRQSRYGLLPVVRQAILSSDYRPGPRRRQDVPKEGREGTRPIEMSNIADRIVERSLLQIIGPFLDARLDPRCLGSRPGIGRETALITAMRLAEQQPRLHWITQDLKDAFTKVPLSRLWSILERQGLPQVVIDLIRRIVGSDRLHGVPQGGPLSGVLLNAYLQSALIQPWKRKHPRVPILLVVDDILIPTGPQDDREAVYQDLHRLALSAGMELKLPRLEAEVDLSRGDRADWLGYSIGREMDQFTIRVGEKAFLKLRHRLVRCHKGSNPPRAAEQTVLGWIRQMGAAYSRRLAEGDVARIEHTARQLGFRELPARGSLLEDWKSAHHRFRCLRRVVGRVGEGVLPDSFANQDPISADSGRGAAGRSRAARSPFFNSSTAFRIWTDGSCLDNPGTGGWAYWIEDDQGRLISQRSGFRLRATNNRMELLAAVEALDSLPSGSHAELFTDSRYLCDGLLNWLPNFLENPHRLHRLRNAGLWLRLVELCRRHTVRCNWIPAHRGIVQNEVVDHLARTAAIQHSVPAASLE